MKTPAATIVGRTSEYDEIACRVESAREGMSGVLVVRGEAGIGKTYLLDAVAGQRRTSTSCASSASSPRCVSASRPCTNLMTPFLKGIDSLPTPQARALKAAFGMSDDVVPDQFLVGLAALTLVTSAATRRQLLIIVDDTQWLDQDSADALGFLARRLYADRVCLLVAMRDTAENRHQFDGLPTLTLAPLSEAASTELLDAAVQGSLADHVRARLLADARGNPLALVEFGRELSPDQVAGVARLSSRSQSTMDSKRTSSGRSTTFHLQPSDSYSPPPPSRRVT